MPRKIITFSCSFCNRFRQTKIESVLKHESRCFKNPKNKACATCKFYRKHLRKDNERDYFIGYVYECLKREITFYTIPSGLSRILININKQGFLISKKDTGIFNPDEKLRFPIYGCLEHKSKLKNKL